MTSKAKPGIIVLCEDDAEVFEWMSDGWFREEVRDTPQAQLIWARADREIKAAADVLDAIRRLKKVGFDVRRELEDELWRAN